MSHFILLFHTPIPFDIPSPLEGELDEELELLAIEEAAKYRARPRIKNDGIGIYI
jgi:hypothetical protein